jgi:hypothetical protein
MNDLLRLLSGGDLRSDGHADQVAEIVLENPGSFDDLFEGIDEQQDLIRGRAAHSLEKVSHTNPELFLPRIEQLLEAARYENLPMARWHYAMIFANLAVFPDQVDRFVRVLFEMLDDKSVFVKSWAISGLTIYARFYPEYSERISSSIESHKDGKSIAIRSKVRNSMECLLDPNLPLPKGWVKSERLLGKSAKLR